MKREEANHELTIDLTRRFMALFANAHGARPACEPQDMLPYKLSFDKDSIIEERPMSVKEIKQLLGARIKKDNGGK